MKSETMDKIKQDWHSWLNTFTNVITIGTIIFFGGAMWQQVGNHENRIGAIELKGSTGLQKHEVFDEERNANQNARLGHLEIAVAAIADLKADQKVLLMQMNSLERLVKEHMQQSQKP